jgi:hypothetical protein
MDKYFPEGNKADTGNVTAYITAKALVQVLKQCGDNLTRDNVMKQAANLDLSPGTLQPGVKITTSASDFFPIKQVRLAKFDGKSWTVFGEALGF